MIERGAARRPAIPAVRCRRLREQQRLRLHVNRTVCTLNSGVADAVLANDGHGAGRCIMLSSSVLHVASVFMIRRYHKPHLHVQYAVAGNSDKSVSEPGAHAGIDGVLEGVFVRRGVLTPLTLPPACASAATANDRPNIVCRAFCLKLQYMVDIMQYLFSLVVIRPNSQYTIIRHEHCQQAD